MYKIFYIMILIFTVNLSFGVSSERNIFFWDSYKSHTKNIKKEKVKHLKLSFTILGVILNNGFKIAIIQNKVTGKIYNLMENDIFYNYKVIKISQNYIKFFEQNKKNEKIILISK